MGFWDWFTSAKPVYNLSDWPEKVPQRTLKELGLDLMYAINPRLWAEFESDKAYISPSSYPFTEAMPGDSYSAETLWDRTPAFQAEYASPVAMLYALLHPKN